MSLPNWISFEDGVCCAAHNEQQWSDPKIQLRERVLNYGRGACLIDAEYQVVLRMSLQEAMRS